MHMPEHDKTPLRPMIGADAVLANVPFSLSTLMRMSREGKFPKPRQIARNRIAWYRDEVEAWQAQLSTDPTLKRRLSRRRKPGKHASERGGVTTVA
jgi:prophage regulatory protein